MVFKAKNAHTYKVRVDHPDPSDGRHAVLTTGCREKSDADDVEAQVRKWEGKKGKKHQRADVIDALIAKRFTLPAAIAAADNGTLEELLERTAPPAPAIDLLPIIDEAVAEKLKSKRGAGQAEVYKQQLLTLFPERPFTLAIFTRKETRDRLAKLDVDAPTKNRYWTAASWLAKYLLATDRIGTNFVRDIARFGENDPREVYYEIADAKRLIRGLEFPYSAIAASALAFCMEWTALEAWVAGDVTFKTDPVVSHVRGTKRAWRDRYVPLVEEFDWTLEYIRPAFEGKLPGIPIFDVPEWRVIRVIRATAKRLGIVAAGEDVYGPHSIHDWRRTHGVALSRWGYHEQVIADHEGHKNVSLVRTNYARFRSTKLDYARKAAPAKGERHG